MVEKDTIPKSYSGILPINKLLTKLQEDQSLNEEHLALFNTKKFSHYREIKHPQALKYSVLLRYVENMVWENTPNSPQKEYFQLFLSFLKSNEDHYRRFTPLKDILDPTQLSALVNGLLRIREQTPLNHELVVEKILSNWDHILLELIEGGMKNLTGRSSEELSVPEIAIAGEEITRVITWIYDLTKSREFKFTGKTVNITFNSTINIAITPSHEYYILYEWRPGGTTREGLLREMGDLLESVNKRIENIRACAGSEPSLNALHSPLTSSHISFLNALQNISHTSSTAPRLQGELKTYINSLQGVQGMHHDINDIPLASLQWIREEEKTSSQENRLDNMFGDKSYQPIPQIDHPGEYNIPPDIQKLPLITEKFSYPLTNVPSYDISTSCIKCCKSTTVEYMNCGHPICKICITETAKAQRQSILIQPQFKCPHMDCFYIYTNEDLQKYLDPQLYIQFSNIMADFEQCGICGQMNEETDEGIGIILLHRAHYMCRVCLKSYIRYKTHNKIVVFEEGYFPTEGEDPTDQLINLRCPFRACSDYITVPQMKAQFSDFGVILQCRLAEIASNNSPIRDIPREGLQEESKEERKEMPPDAYIQDYFGEDLLNQPPIEKYFVMCKCECCFVEYDVQDIRTLDCNHIMCNECIRRFCETRSNEGLHVLVCPKEFCKKNIDFHIIQAIMGEEYAHNASIITYKLHAVLFKCPECNDEFEIPKDILNRNIRCNGCHNHFCRICKAPFHEAPICTERQKLINTMKGMGKCMVPCPYCLVLCEKLGEECDHVKCFWCKNDFCIGCGAKRNPTLEHGNHYHRKECEHYRAYEGEEQWKANCEMCAKSEENHVCLPPLNLVDGDIPPEEKSII